VAKKTADNLMYAFASGASDGTQLFAGFSMYDFATDANGIAYFGTSAVPSWFNMGNQSMPYFYAGTFDPLDLRTAAAPATQVLTFTPTNVEIGDIFSIIFTDGGGNTETVTFTATAATAGNVAAALVALVNANDIMSQEVTATGTVTVILTANVPGNAPAFTSTAVNGGAADTQTLTKVVTTAATGRSIGDITTSRPGAVVLPGNGFWLIPG
jgi:hypothetical protein